MCFQLNHTICVFVFLYVYPKSVYQDEKNVQNFMFDIDNAFSDVV